MKHVHHLFFSLAFAGALVSGVGAGAQVASNGDGTASIGPFTAQAERLAVDDVFPSFVVENSALYSAGVGLRNRSGGAIEISGLEPWQEVRSGYLYWNVLSLADQTAEAGYGEGSSLYIQRVSPTRSPPRLLEGEVVGMGGTPCWGQTDTNTVYRARVRANVLTGNGTYLITPDPEYVTRTDGSPPWGYSGSVMVNGASLFVIATGDSVVSLYDSPLAGTDYVGSPGLSARIRFPRQAWEAYETRVHIVSSDGQSFGPFPEVTFGLAGEDTLINGTAVAGPSSESGSGSELNGADGGPLVQLWDTSMHDISALVPSGVRGFTLTFATDVPQNSTATDCLVPVAVGVERRGGYTAGE
jgi:hypothetical protein